jgi:hypothetical protein
MTIDGDVVAVHSFWTKDETRIMTEATVRTPDGNDVVVTQLGGAVDDIGMITFPGPQILEVGMTVAVAAHSTVDDLQHEHIMLDDVKVLAYPPNFVRSGPSENGHYLYWQSSCVYVTIDDAGTTAIQGDQEFAAIDAAINTWNNATSGCSYLTLINDGRKALEVSGKDHINLIKFRDSGWSHSINAAALTTVTYIKSDTRSDDGAIVDADIEINAVNFTVTLDSRPTAVPSNAVLQNTLTHELGHLQGLEHPCRVGNDPERVDNLGNPVPTCFGSSDPPSIADLTMYNFQDPGETKKESLEADDINGICTVYPTAKDPGACERVGSATAAGCCSASRGPDVSLLLAGTTVLIMLRRRKISRNA